MKRYLSLWFLLLLLLPRVLFSSPSISLGGYIEESAAVPLSWDGSWDELTISTDLKLHLDYHSDFLDIYASGIASLTDIAEPWDAEELFAFTPDEIRADLAAGNIDLSLGYQRFSWGRTDGINPTDNINPIDMSDLLSLASTERSDIVQPVPALAVNWYPTDFMMVEGVFVPLFTAPGMPDISSYLPEDLSSLTVRFHEPERELASFEAGLRTGFFLSAVDFSLSYLYTWDQVPDIADIGIALQDMGGYTIGIPTSVDLTFNRVHIIGGDFALPIGEIDFRGEAAYTFTQDWEGSDIRVKNPSFQYAIEAGYTFFDSLTAQLIFSQTLVPGFRKISDYEADLTAVDQSETYYEEAYTINFSPLLSRQRGPAGSTLMLILTSPLFSDYLEAALIGIYNFPSDYDDDSQEKKYGDFMLAPSLTYQIADALSLELGAHLFFSYKQESSGDVVSDRYTTFGMADDLDQVRVAVRYTF